MQARAVKVPSIATVDNFFRHAHPAPSGHDGPRGGNDEGGEDVAESARGSSSKSGWSAAAEFPPLIFGTIHTELVAGQRRRRACTAGHPSFKTPERLPHIVLSSEAGCGQKKRRGGCAPTVI